MELKNRIKDFYEGRSQTSLMRRMITIIRLDGKGFSTYTKKLNKPFDDDFSNDMDKTAAYLCANIQGAKFAYTQSDEISVVICDFDTLETDAWFDYNVQKMVSIAASMATAKFNQLRLEKVKAGTFANETYAHPKLAYFDARVFQVPTVDEMVNTMLWRQQDCTKNSISMAASEYFSHNETEGKNGSEKQEMLFALKGINWNNYKTKYKRGSVIKKEMIKIGTSETLRSRWVADENTPIFSEDRDYLYKLIPTI